MTPARWMLLGGLIMLLGAGFALAWALTTTEPGDRE